MTTLTTSFVLLVTGHADDLFVGVSRHDSTPLYGFCVAQEFVAVNEDHPVSDGGESHQIEGGEGGVINVEGIARPSSLVGG